MKRVCHISTVHDLLDNRIFYKECNTLAQNGHKVTLIAPIKGVSNKNGIEIIYIKKFKNRLLRFILSSFFLALIKSWKVKAELYHFHDAELIPMALVLKLLKKKVVYDIHENVSASILGRPYIKNLRLKKKISQLFDRFEKKACQYLDGLVCATPDISSYFVHPNVITLRNLPILPEGDDNDKLFIIKKERPVVIYAGVISRIRGIMELLEAVAQLPEIEFWLLGKFDDKKTEQDCKKHKGWKNTRYFGFLPVKEVYKYIKKADIGIVTFLPLPNHIKSLANKPFEYMACGLPVIMSDFPYWQETFKENAFFVDPINSKEIAERIKFVLSSPDLMEMIGKRNKEMVYSKFNWEIESKKLVELYDKLLK